MGGIRWQESSNTTFKRESNKLVETRDQIAHGKRPSLRLQQLRRWTGMVRKYAEVLETRIAGDLRERYEIEMGW